MFLENKKYILFIYLIENKIEFIFNNKIKKNRVNNKLRIS